MEIIHQAKFMLKIRKKSALEVGIKSEIIKYPKSISEQEILKKIDELNKDKKISGILVQLPLPDQISKEK